MAGYGHTMDEWESLRVMTFPIAAIPDVYNPLTRGEVVPFIVRNQSGVSAMTVASAYGITAVLCMGLLRGGELYGVHTAGYRHRNETFAPEQQQIASGIAQLASLALENARLLIELDRANQLKSEFVATMSHELRTPLNVITGYADMMLDGAYGSLPSDLRDPLLRVRKSADGLLDLVSSTLDLSRLETGRVGVEISALELPPFIDAIINEARDTLMKANVEIVNTIVTPVPIVHTDPRKLKVVLKNLINNAVKFTEEGRITVTLRSEANGILFTVSDTGIGIIADALPTIFEAFRQAAPSSKRDYGGVGLGLYIVRRLLDLLDGTVWIDSQPNVGTTVRVWLPIGVDPRRA
jgi:signal transduction histidine kinase